MRLMEMLRDEGRGRRKKAVARRWWKIMTKTEARVKRAVLRGGVEILMII